MIEKKLMGMLACLCAGLLLAMTPGALAQDCPGQGGDCCMEGGNGTPGCDDVDCCLIVCAMDPFCCDTSWDGICADEAQQFCELCFVPGCDLVCPPESIDEGEPCGDDNNGGCNSTPPAFIDALCGQTWCGTAWADGGSRDTDWYLIQHGGGILSGTLVSEFPGVCFIVDGIPACAPVVVGDIGCSENCEQIQVASADLPPGGYVVFVATGNCAGGGVFEGYPCGGENNDYYVTIDCVGAILGACCLPDGTCVDGVTQEECETPPDMADCGDCDMEHPTPGCSDPECEALVCAIDPFCCDVEWDGICVGEAQDLCDCGGGGGLGGLWQGEGTTCDDPGVCGPLTGACCICPGDICEIVTEEECFDAGGVYLGDGSECFEGGMGEVVVVDQDVNAPIPDNDEFGVSATIMMGMSFMIADLDVDLTIDHTFVGDLCVVLEGPDGTTVELIRRPGLDPDTCGPGSCCGCGANNYAGIVLDDEGAGGFIEDLCVEDLASPPNYVPNNPLSAFDGTDSAGMWTLTVLDGAGADTGTLVSWSLHFTQAGEPIDACAEAGVFPCVLPGACCFADGSCMELFEDECMMEGGEFQGEGTFCDPNPCPQPAFLDIKPGSCPNAFNWKSKGKMPVALVGTETFDVTMVDLDSLFLVRADGVGGMVAPLFGPPGPGVSYGDVATPFFGELCDCHEMDGDGIMDLELKFHTPTLVEVLELMGLDGDLELCLVGTFMDGTPFMACDCISFVPIMGSGMQPASMSDEARSPLGGGG